MCKLRNCAHPLNREMKLVEVPNYIILSYTVKRINSNVISYIVMDMFQGIVVLEVSNHYFQISYLLAHELK